MSCVLAKSQEYDYPPLSVSTTFCPNYTDARVTVSHLRWFNSAGEDMCQQRDKPRVASPGTGDSTGWEPTTDLDTSKMGC